MSQLEELGFGSYAEEAKPVTLGEYLGMVGDMGRGTASGVVGMPYTMARGLDDIFDIMLEQDVENDASIVRNMEPLRDLANYIQPEGEIGQMSREMIGESLGVVAGPATGVNLARTLGEYFMPNIAYDEAIRRGMSKKDATAISLATGAAFGLGRGRMSPTRTDMAVTLPSGKTLPDVQTQKKGEVAEEKAVPRVGGAGFVLNPQLSEIDDMVAQGKVSLTQGNNIKREVESNPIYAKVMRDREAGNRSVSTEDLSAGQVNYEGLLGNVGVVLPADATSTSRQVERIGGVDVDPFVTEGGPRHADKYGFWRSEESAANSKQAHIDRVAKETNTTPLAIYLGMDNAGSNFSTMPSEGVLAYLKATGNFTPESAAKMVELQQSLPNVRDTRGIAEYYPDTLDLGELEGYLLDRSTVTKGSPSLGDRRKAFMNKAANVDLTRLGFPDVQDVYAAVNEPSLLQKGINDAGYRGMVTVPNAPTYKADGHRSYGTVIAGDGGFEIADPMVPWNIMFPSLAEARSGKTPAAARRSTQTSGGAQDYQVFDEQWLEGIMRYLGEL